MSTKKPFFLMFQFNSVTQLCLTHCDPMDPSTSGLPVHHQLPELIQTHAHWVRDAIQQSGFFFPMSQLFTSGGQSIRASASASVLPVNIQGWFPLGLTSLILLSKGLKSLLQHHSLKTSILWQSTFFRVQLPHPYMTTGKTIALTIWTFVSKVMFLVVFKNS